MIDWSDLRDRIWEERWNSLLLLWDGLWVAAAANWWVGPLFVVVVATLGRKKLSKLLREIGVTFVRGNAS